GGAVKAKEWSLAAREPSFQQDNNGDGTTSLEAVGATSLAQVGSNYFLYANGTTTGPSLKSNGAPVTAAVLGGWTPIGAERTASGDREAVVKSASGQFAGWATDSSDNDAGNIVGAGHGEDHALA